MKIFKKKVDIKKRISDLEERQTILERQFKDGLSGTTLILGACDIDEIVNVLEKRLTKRQLESGTSYSEHPA